MMERFETCVRIFNNVKINNKIIFVFVSQASGEVSGGVCDDCQHNTEGTHCEECITGYYQDPEKQLTDPDICKLCDCRAEGTIDDGMCDMRTSDEAEPPTVAGQCHCKTYVSGPRCDHCTPGDEQNYNQFAGAVPV